MDSVGDFIIEYNVKVFEVLSKTECAVNRGVLNAIAYVIHVAQKSKTVALESVVAVVLFIRLRSVLYVLEMCPLVWTEINFYISMQ